MDCTPRLSGLVAALLIATAAGTAAQTATAQEPAPPEPVAPDPAPKESMATVFEETLLSEGLAAATARFHEMMADTARYELNPYELAIALPERLARQGRRADGIELLKLLEPTFGDDPRYWIEIGKAYLLHGDRDNAETSLNRALEIDPDRGDIRWMVENLEELIRVARLQAESEGRWQPGENTGLTGDYLGQEPPGDKPEVFAPGILCTTTHEYSITISPDGNEIIFSRSGIGLMVCRREEAGWTAPEVLTLIEGDYSDEANFSPDGESLFFCSRPNLRHSRELWVIEREGDGWSEPRHLFPGMYPTVTRDGTLYYTADIPGQRGNSDTVCRRRTATGYAEPVTPTGGINSDTQDAHPFIAPDESWVLFDSARDGRVGLCVSYRLPDGTWSEATPLRDVLGIPPAGQPALSPDGRYVFFCLAGDMYWVRADFLEDLRPDQGSGGPPTRNGLE